MACEEPFNYHSGFWLLLSHIILSQTSSKLRNDSIENSEVDNCLEKIRVCWPCKGCQVSVRFFSFPPMSSQTELCHINKSHHSDWNLLSILDFCFFLCSVCNRIVVSATENKIFIISLQRKIQGKLLQYNLPSRVNWNLSNLHQRSFIWSLTKKI